MFPFPSGSKNPFLSRPPSPECSEPETKSTVQEVDFSSTILCTNCLHTFPAPDQTTAPYTSEKLRAKHVPFDAEITGIQTCIDDLTNNLSGYYVEIKRFEQILAKLSRQRDCLERYREEYLTLLSPIRRLPAEILSKIFQYHCQTPMSLQGTRRSHGITGQEEGIIQAPALYLSHVCSFWRELSFSIPSLWASLDIDIDLFDPLSYGQMRILHIFIENSCSCPLTIKLKAGREYSTDLVFGVLADLSHRWQTVTWETVDRYNPIDTSSQSIGLNLPLLTSLSIKNDNLLNLQTVFGETPALQQLTLEDVNFDSTFGSMLSCKQLKTIVVKRQPVGQTLIVLENCPDLQSVEISQNHSHWFPPPWQPFEEVQSLTVELGKLTSLIISADYGDFERFFDSITAPVLTSLSLLSLLGGTSFPARAFLGFLSRSSTSEVNSLKELRLDSIEIDESYLLEVLQHTPKLRHLGIRDISSVSKPWTQYNSPSPSPILVDLPIISNYFLRTLTIISPHLLPSTDHPSPVILPELHAIDFVLKYNSIDYGVLTDMVTSRSKPNSDIGLVSPLRNVSIRQGTMWIPGFRRPEPSTHFMRPLVALEPVILDDWADQRNGPSIIDADTDFPDPDLMDEDEIAYQKVERTNGLEKDAYVDAQGLATGGDNRIERVKDKIWRYIWWGGSLVTPEFSFVRLVSGVL